MKILLSIAFVIGCGFLGYYIVRTIIDIIKTIKVKKTKEKGGE